MSSGNLTEWLNYLLTSVASLLIINHMVNYCDDKLDLIFHALADRTRRGILRQVSQQESTVGELAEPYAMSLPAISKHLKILERAGLVKKTKEGRIFRCSLDPEPLEEVVAHLAYYRKFWSARLDSLEDFLTELKPEP